MEKPWSCYCLESEIGNTYIGSTVDVDRRLRQHNGEITGGAKCTSRGSGWKRICHVVGFPTSKAALQFEWRWKRLSKGKAGSPLQRRIYALTELLNLEKATGNAVPFSEWDGPLIILVDDASKIELFKDKEMRYGILG